MTKTLSKIMHNGDEYNFPAWVEWPSSSTDGHLAVFDGTTGKLLKDWWAVPTVPTNVSAFTNDAGYLVSNDVSTFITEDDASVFLTADDVSTFITSSQAAESFEVKAWRGTQAEYDQLVVIEQNRLYIILPDE